MIEAIEQLLAETAGLNVEALGRAALNRVVTAHMVSHAIPDPTGYIALLRGSKDELNSLVEDLTVRETWFFRDRGPFEFLEQYALGRETLRVLSAPCATGEEAYSIAITLLRAGLSPSRFQVDACDISQRALEFASRGIYGASSFRDPWPDDRNRWFEPANGGFALRPEVAGLVQFHRDDLLHPVFVTAQPPYDVVFCRNLLIYLRPEAQRTLIERIGCLIPEDGIVVTGHAEVATVLRHGFEAVPYRRSFACRRRQPESAPPTVRKAVQRPLVTPPRRAPVVRTPECRPAPDRGDLLKRARRLADEGALEDAWGHCKELLAQGPDTEIYYLAGLICAARDRLVAAEEYFRRALYLDPAHYESLIQMSLLCERQGEPARSRLFRTRASKLATSRPEVIDGRRP